MISIGSFILGDYKGYLRIVDVQLRQFLRENAMEVSINIWWKIKAVHIFIYSKNYTIQKYVSLLNIFNTNIPICTTSSLLVQCNIWVKSSTEKILHHEASFNLHLDSYHFPSKVNIVFLPLSTFIYYRILLCTHLKFFKLLYRVLHIFISIVNLLMTNYAIISI